MRVFIPLLLIGVLYSIHAGFFLAFYHRLKRAGNKTTGTIVSFDRSNFIIFREILVPVVRFKMQNSSLVEGQPDYTYFHEFNGFVRQGEVTVYYQEDNPKIFVIEGKPEILINWIIIAVTLIGVVWLFTH